MTYQYTPEDNLARYRSTVATLITKYGNKYAVPTEEYARAGERLRSENVVAKAIRDGENVARALRAHFVAQSFINDLGFETPVAPQRKGTRAIDEFVSSNPGAVVDVPTLAEHASCSEATVRNFIRLHRSRFRKAGRGLYEVVDPVEARKEGK